MHRVPPPSWRNVLLKGKSDRSVYGHRSSTQTDYRPAPLRKTSFVGPPPPGMALLSGVGHGAGKVSAAWPGAGHVGGRHGAQLPTHLGPLPSAPTQGSQADPGLHLTAAPGV